MVEDTAHTYADYTFDQAMRNRDRDLRYLMRNAYLITGLDKADPSVNVEWYGLAPFGYSPQADTQLHVRRVQIRITISKLLSVG